MGCYSDKTEVSVKVRATDCQTGELPAARVDLRITDKSLEKYPKLPATKLRKV